MKKKTKNEIKFNNFVYFLIFFLFVVLSVRIAYLSLSSEVDGINLQEFASKRTTRKEVISAKRGAIYDVNGKVLAQNVYSYTLIAYLEESRGEGNYVSEKEKTAEALSTVIEMDKEKILNLLNKDAYQTEFGTKGKGLTELTKEKIEALDLDGIDFLEDQKRYYPNQDFLSYTLGYAKTDNEGNIIGELGLESLFNKELTGTDGYRIYQKDLKGYKIAGTYEDVVESVDGYDIYLTIDADIQMRLEEAVEEAEDKYDFEQLNIVVAEAKTGKILGIATTPSFDPNIRDIKNYLDPNVSIAIEPGSTMKIFSYMAVMESGKYNGEETFKSGTFTTTDKTVIGDWDRKGWGTISYDKGFALSSNVGVVNLIDKYLTKEELSAFYKKLGFGTKTGIELAGEVSGKIDFKYETEVFNAGFGQGITTTSIQNIQALTSLANDGMLLKPYLVEKIIDKNGNIIVQNEKTEIRKVASPETIKKLKDLMEDVVESGTGTSYKMEGYDLIAKTGTAQIAKEDGGGYLSGETNVIRGFAGLYPKDNPDIIIYANMKKPTSNTVTPLALVVKKAIENISKIRNNTSMNTNEEMKTVSITSYLNKDVEKVRETLEKEGLEVIVIGSGSKVIGQYPEKNITVTTNTKVFLLTEDEKIGLPSMIGWSKKDVNAYCILSSLSCTLEGNGYVKEVKSEDVQEEKIKNIHIILEKKFE